MPLSRSAIASSPRAQSPIAWVGAVLFLAVVLLVSGCTVPVPGKGNAATGPEQTSQAPAPAKLTVTPANGAKNVPIVDAVTAKVEGGKISRAVLTNDAGKVIDGALTPDGQSWKPVVPLGYGRKYTLAVTYAGQAQPATTDTRSFTMVDPQSIVTPQLVTSGGGTLGSNREYGVGIIIGVRFDQAVKDRTKVEKYMQVTTSPAVEGNWFWLNDTTAHWRPKNYYTTGTKVDVKINTYGQDLGGGQSGGDNTSANFTIGQRRVAIADDNTKTVTVFYDQKEVRSMPTSMGQGGYATYNGTSMHFWTQKGTYTVLDKASPVIMDSSTYGLPVSSRLGYRESIDDAVRISNDGIYLHALASSVWAQGNTNVSHGCLNLSPSNAKWYFDQAVTGDVVEVRNTGGPALEVWQNGDWSVPWEVWKKGSAT